VSPKRTQQRAAVSQVLRETGGFRAAQQLHEELRANGGSVGLATVYRTLRSMAEAGEVDVLHPPGGEAIYRLCESQAHHHHLVCRSCGTAVEIESPDVEDWAQRTAQQHHFRAVAHTAELYGLCSICAEKGPPKRRIGVRKRES
jgi:Fur family transcriptional regulator, ferric uptake regulator